MTDTMPSFTAEALVAVAVGYQLVPPPLLLVQLGFDPSADDADSQYFGVIERGSRTLATLHEALDPGDDLKAELGRIVRAMCETAPFVTLRRTERTDSQVLYCGESAVVDDVDDVGNHRPRLGGDVRSELERFFDGYDEHDELVLTVPVGRLAPDAESAEGEHPIVSEMVSSESALVVSIGRAAEGRLRILHWCSLPDRLVRYESSGDDVVFTATSTSEAVETVLAALEEIGSAEIG